MDKEFKPTPIQKAKFRLFFELHLDFNEIDFDAVAKCYNILLEHEGSSVRVTKEQCEEYIKKHPLPRAEE